MLRSLIIEVKQSAQVARALEQARQEASKLNADHVDTGHLLLCIIQAEDGEGFRILQDANADIECIRSGVEVVSGKKAARKPTEKIPPDSPQITKILDRAKREAERRRQNEVTCDHILICLLAPDSGKSYQVLDRCGCNIDKVRGLLDDAISHKVA